MQQQLELCAHQDLVQDLHQEQALVQIPRLAVDFRNANFFDKSWLTGSIDDLITLLTEYPQRDEERDTLSYLISGGWAVEMLTGKKREHHDLDIISLQKIPLAYRVD